MGNPVDGNCALEVRELPEWKAVNMAMRAFEDKILAKVDAALAEVREDLLETDTKVCGALAPMVERLALEQMDMRRASDCIRPMLECIAMDHIDMRAKIAGHGAEESEDEAEETLSGVVPPAATPADPAKQDIIAPQLIVYPVMTPGTAVEGPSDAAISEACNRIRDESMEEAKKDIEELEKRLREDMSNRLKAVEQADEYLFSEMRVVGDIVKLTHEDVKQLQTDVQEIERKQADQEEQVRACSRGGDGGSPNTADKWSQFKHMSANPDARLGWGDGLPMGIPFSGKVAVDFLQGGAPSGRKSRRAGKQMGVEPSSSPEAAAPFARGPLARALPGSQSMPYLPPLH